MFTENREEQTLHKGFIINSTPVHFLSDSKNVTVRLQCVQKHTQKNPGAGKQPWWKFHKAGLTESLTYFDKSGLSKWEFCSINESWMNPHWVTMATYTSEVSSGTG